MKRKKATRSKAPRVLQSVDRAAQVLTLLAGESEGLALGEMASLLGLKPQTLQGIVRSLQAHDLVLQAERGGPYALGPRVHELSRRWLAGCDRAVLARDVVRDLVGRIGESVMLGELRGDRVVGLLDVNADRPLSVVQNRMPEVPMHTMATGKILLAFLPEERRGELVAAQDFTPLAPGTIGNAEALVRELGRVRARGWAMVKDESTEGMVAMGVAVRGVGGEVEAALGVSMPQSRYSVARRTELIAELRAAAAEIERRWGVNRE